MSMMTSRQIIRTQKRLLWAAVGLVLYYWIGYRPLADRSESLNQPLAQAWKKLHAADSGAGGDHLDLFKIEREWRETQNALQKLQQAENVISTNLALASALRAKINEPFQLIDFQIEEQYRFEELSHLAAQNQVTLPPALFDGFPAYTADKAQPGFLWAQLFFLDRLLTTAVEAKVSQIQSISLPLISGHQLASTNRPFLYEIPVRMEVVGSVESISRLLARLPQREEMKLTNGSSPLFIHRFILQKSSPKNPEEARLDLRACGFIYPD